MAKTTKEKLYFVRQELDELRRAVDWLRRELEKKLKDSGLKDELIGRGLPAFQVKQDKYEAQYQDKTVLALEDAVACMDKAMEHLDVAYQNQ